MANKQRVSSPPEGAKGEPTGNLHHLGEWRDGRANIQASSQRRIGHRGGLDPQSVRDIVQKRCLQAGLAGKFSAHSLRSGFVTGAGRRQVNMSEAMRMTGHNNVETFMGYHRSGDVLGSSVARMLE